MAQLPKGGLVRGHDKPIHELRHLLSRWYISYFHPDPWGRKSPILTDAHIFQIGLVQPPTRNAIPSRLPLNLSGDSWMYPDPNIPLWESPI